MLNKYLCDKCGGKCCYAPNLHKSEVEIIKKEVDKFPLIEKKTNLYQVIPKDGKCYFLGKKYCLLKHKPLSCKIAPFFPHNGKFVLRVDICKYWDKFGKDKLREAKRMFKANKRYWVDKEDK